MKKIFLFIAVAQFIGIVPIFIGTTTVQAANTGASFLKIGIGARPIGMGSAFTAIADDVNAIGWNPAGLAQLTKPEISAMHNEWLLDTKYDFVGYIHPVKNGVLGVSLIYLSQGDLEGRSENREKTGSFGASNLAISLSYSRLVNTSLGLGMNVKLIRQQIETEQADGIAVDLGLLTRAGSINRTPTIQFGLAIQNIGPQMKFISEGYNLPLTLTGGIGYNIGGVTVALDIKNQIYENRTVVSIGTEYLPVNMLALRAGYLLPLVDSNASLDDQNDWLTNLDGLGAGIGLKILGIQTDYSFVPYGELGNTHRMSFTARF